MNSVPSTTRVKLLSSVIVLLAAIVKSAPSSKLISVSTGIIRTLEVDHSVVCNTAAGCELLPAYSRADGEFAIVVFGGYGYSSPRLYERKVCICALMCGDGAAAVQLYCNRGF